VNSIFAVLVAVVDVEVAAAVIVSLAATSGRKVAACVLEFAGPAIIGVRVLPATKVH
jgi:hypothetical protein